MLALYYSGLLAPPLALHSVLENRQGEIFEKDCLSVDSCPASPAPVFSQLSLFLRMNEGRQRPPLKASG